MVQSQRQRQLPIAPIAPITPQRATTRPRWCQPRLGMSRRLWLSGGLALLVLVSGCWNGGDRAATEGVVDATSTTANTPPTATTPPTLTAAEQRDVLNTVLTQANALNLCDDNLDRAVADEYSAVYPLDAANYLVEITCQLAAYQTAYTYVLYQPGSDEQPAQVNTLPLRSYQEVGIGQFEPATTRTVGGLATYDPTAQRLTLFTKYRGLGDCGALAIYDWTGLELQLQSFQAKTNCDGEYVDPNNYPMVYPEAKSSPQPATSTPAPIDSPAPPLSTPLPEDRG